MAKAFPEALGPWDSRLVQKRTTAAKRQGWAVMLDLLQGHGVMLVMEHRTVRLYLESCVHPGALHNKKDTEVLEHVQRRAMGLGKSLEHRSHQEQHRQLRMFILEKKRLKSDLVILYNSLKGNCSQVSLSSQVKSDRTRENGIKLYQGRFALAIRKKFFTERIEQYWSGMTKEVAELPTLEALKKLGDMV